MCQAYDMMCSCESLLWYIFAVADTCFQISFLGPMEETPLHLAASIGDVLVLQSLLDKNPNLLIANKAGKSVLQADIKPSIKEVILKHAKR